MTANKYNLLDAHLSGAISSVNSAETVGALLGVTTVAFNIESNVYIVLFSSPLLVGCITGRGLCCCLTDCDGFVNRQQFRITVVAFLISDIPIVSKDSYSFALRASVGCATLSCFTPIVFTSCANVLNKGNLEHTCFKAVGTVLLLRYQGGTYLTHNTGDNYCIAKGDFVVCIATGNTDVLKASFESASCKAVNVNLVIQGNLEVNNLGGCVSFAIFCTSNTNSISFFRGQNLFTANGALGVFSIPDVCACCFAFGSATGLAGLGSDAGCFGPTSCVVALSNNLNDLCVKDACFLANVTVNGGVYATENALEKNGIACLGHFLTLGKNNVVNAHERAVCSLNSAEAVLLVCIISGSAVVEGNGNVIEIGKLCAFFKSQAKLAGCILGESVGVSANGALVAFIKGVLMGCGNYSFFGCITVVALNGALAVDGAGRSSNCGDLGAPGVACCRNYSFFGCIAVVALNGALAISGAGGSGNSGDLGAPGVTCCIDLFGYNVAAGAGVGLKTFLKAGGSLNGLDVAVNVLLFLQIEEEASKVLRLFEVVRCGDLKGVFAFVEFHFNEHINTNQEAVVLNLCSVIGSRPSVGGLEGVLTGGTFVNGELSAADLFVLYSEVNSNLVSTGFVYGYLIFQILITLFGCVVVRIRKRRILLAFVYFIVVAVVSTDVITLSVNVDQVVSESFGKSLCKIEDIGLTVTIVINDRALGNLVVYVFAVVAYAVLDEVLVVYVNVSAILTNAPLEVISRIGGVILGVFLIAVLFAGAAVGALALYKGVRSALSCKLNLLNGVTNGTGLGLVTGCGAGCGSYNDFLAVSVLTVTGDSFFLGALTYRAGVQSYTVCARRSGGNNACIPGVFAGCGNCLFLGCIAVFALNGALAVCCAGGSGNGGNLGAPIVTVCGSKLCLAYGAGLVGGAGCCCAGGVAEASMSSCASRIASQTEQILPAVRPCCVQVAGIAATSLGV